MSSAGDRFLKGLLYAGRGISRAYVDAQRDLDERKRQERQDRETAARNDIMQRYYEAQIAKMQTQPAKEPHIISNEHGIYEYDYGTNQIRQLQSFPEKPSKDENAPTYTIRNDEGTISGKDIGRVKAAAIEAGIPYYKSPEAPDESKFIGPAIQMGSITEPRELKRTTEELRQLYAPPKITPPVGRSVVFNNQSRPSPVPFMPNIKPHVASADTISGADPLLALRAEYKAKGLTDEEIDEELKALGY